MLTATCQSPRRCGRLLLPAFFAALTLLPSAPAMTQDKAIDARYQLLSTTAQAGGNYAATFAFTFTNTGTVDFNDARVTLIASPPYKLLQPLDLAVGQLLIGESAGGSWQVQLDHPVESDVGLEFLGEADDADGTTGRIPVLIQEAGAQQ